MKIKVHLYNRSQPLVIASATDKMDDDLHKVLKLAVRRMDGGGLDLSVDGRRLYIPTQNIEWIEVEE